MSAPATGPHIFIDEHKTARFKRQPRIRVSFIVTFNRVHGRTPKEITEDVPLTLEEVNAALAYCEENKEEIDREFAELEADYQRWLKTPLTPVELRLRELKAKSMTHPGDVASSPK